MRGDILNFVLTKILDKLNVVVLYLSYNTNKLNNTYNYITNQINNVGIHRGHKGVVADKGVILINA